MSAQSDNSHKLSDFGVDTGEMTGDEWRRRYEDVDGDFDRLADATGKSKREVFEALVEIDIVEPYADYYVARLWPHELGLSALNCADCGEPNIEQYPCESCGHNPGIRGDE